MDTFVEQLVVKKNTGRDTVSLIIKILALFAIPGIFVLLGALVNFYFIIVAICAFFFVAYASYYVITGMYLEYEYAITNSNITIDKVIAKRNRKRIISVDIKRFNTLNKVSSGDFEKKSYRKVFNASITPNGENVYGAEMHLDKFGGECLLLFSPNEKILNAMKPYLKMTARANLTK